MSTPELRRTLLARHDYPDGKSDEGSDGAAGDSPDGPCEASDDGAPASPQERLQHYAFTDSAARTDLLVMIQD